MPRNAFNLSVHRGKKHHSFLSLIAFVSWLHKNKENNVGLKKITCHWKPWYNLYHRVVGMEVSVSCGSETGSRDCWLHKSFSRPFYTFNFLPLSACVLCSGKEGWEAYVTSRMAAASSPHYLPHGLVVCIMCVCVCVCAQVYISFKNPALIFGI